MATVDAFWWSLGLSSHFGSQRQIVSGHSPITILVYILFVSFAALVSSYIYAPFLPCEWMPPIFFLLPILLRIGCVCFFRNPQTDRTTNYDELPRITTNDHYCDYSFVGPAETSTGCCATLEDPGGTVVAWSMRIGRKEKTWGFWVNQLLNGRINWHFELSLSLYIYVYVHVHVYVYVYVSVCVCVYVYVYVDVDR